MLASDLAFIDPFAERSPLEAPKYRRFYARWNEELKNFVRDLEQTFVARQVAKPKKHCFGGIVCLHYAFQITLGRRHEVIDRQQRLATFGVFFACLRYRNSRG